LAFVFSQRNRFFEVIADDASDNACLGCGLQSKLQHDRDLERGKKKGGLHLTHFAMLKEERLP
ncbi:hypothetical protein CEXT_201121, partial [Caerostris extrusa]